MKRRSFLKHLAAASGALSLPAWSQDLHPAGFRPAASDPWRNFEITTHLELPAGPAQLWIPVPSITEAEWSMPAGNVWSGNADSIAMVRDTVSGAAMVHAEWQDATRKPVLDVVSTVRTRNRAIDLQHKTTPAPLSEAERAYYTRATELLPTDGIVRDTAEDIVRGRHDDEARARALYEWIVQNTVRDPKTRGCGTGDIRAILESGNLGGKCADLNALYVGLARAVGLPARDLYGIRVADSRFGYKSLGKSGNISKAQHCRAEVWLATQGWVPVDPADVRKVMLEEPPGGRTLDDPMVTAVHQRLFGAWEGNWIAYNDAHDLDLPGAKGPRIPFLMYPQGETSEGRLDSLDPSAFGYTISARELTL